MAIHAPVTVYTVGHSNLPFDKLAQLLQQHRIEVLVDVRSKPRSRWVPHFNQRSLETALPKAGIDYKYFGKELGGLPDDPAYYKPNPQHKRKTDPKVIVDYGKIAQQDWYRDAINKLIEAASEHRTAIVCSEEDPKKCHRSQLVGDTLTERGITVVHIRKDGNLEPSSA